MTGTAIARIDASNSLADLRERLKAEHAAVTTALKTSLTHAMAAGDILIEAKAQLKHGQWLPWLKSAGLSERTAQRYIRLARHRAAIEANPTRVSDLGIGGALAMLVIRRDHGDPLARLEANAADKISDDAFHDFCALTAPLAAERKACRALSAEALKTVDKMISIVKDDDALLESLEIHSARFYERLHAACAEYSSAVAAGLGITERQLTAIREGRLEPKSILRIARDPRPGPVPSTIMSKVRDIANEWLRCVEQHAARINGSAGVS